MAEISATILIPDISGFTEFVTKTELTHGSKAINMLIDAIVQAVGEEYEVSEIEGDAVLLIRQGPIPSRKEIEDICLKIFNAFHYQRKWISQHTICPCKACQLIVTLTLKFVVHHGPLAEIKVGRFVKHSGTEMIVAHRLLKNSIQNNEYLLLTEKLVHSSDDNSDTAIMEWHHASDEFSSLGQIKYQFALLNAARNTVPDPPLPDNSYLQDETPFYETEISAGFQDVYMAMMNIPGRHTWMPGLVRVEQEMPDVFVGSRHHCVFANQTAIVSPLQMHLSDDHILYAESCTVDDISLKVVHEFVFKKTDQYSSVFAARFMNSGDSPLSSEHQEILHDRLAKMAEGLKQHCEGLVAA